MRKKIKESIVIYNPVSTGFNKNDLEKIEHTLKSENILPIFLESRYPGNLPELIKQTDDRSLLILTLGGDGTVSEAYKAFNEINQKGIYAHIPTGTTNDMASNFDVKSNDIETILKDILNGEIKYFDSFSVNDKVAAYTSVFGYMAHIPYITNQKIKKTLKHSGYIATAIPELIKTPDKYNITCSLNNITINDDYIIGAVSNSKGFAGINLYKDVRLDDGVLELLLVRNLDIKIIYKLFLDYLKNNIDLHKYNENIVSLKASEIKLTFNNNYPKYPIDIDGENSNIIISDINNTLVFKPAKKIKILKAKK